MSISIDFFHMHVTNVAEEILRKLWKCDLWVVSRLFYKRCHKLLIFTLWYFSDIKRRFKLENQTSRRFSLFSLHLQMHFSFLIAIYIFLQRLIFGCNKNKNSIIRVRKGNNWSNFFKFVNRLLAINKIEFFVRNLNPKNNRKNTILLISGALFSLPSYTLSSSPPHCC